MSVISTKLRELDHDLWAEDLADLAWSHWLMVAPLRTMVLVYRGFWHHHLTTRAAALTYTTIFSLIPILAVAFSMFSAFGLLESARRLLLPHLIDYLAVGVRDQAAARIEEMLANVDTGTLGALGTLGLIVAALSLLNSVENAFNEIWGARETRGYLQRLAVYWAVVTFSPVLLFAGLSLSAAAADFGPLRWLFVEGGPGNFVLADVAPLLLVWCGFTLMYWLLTSVRIPWRAAVVSGVGGGTLWWIAVHGYAAYVRSSLYYGAIYGPLATGFFFLFWLYLSWAIVLVGALLGYATQNIDAFRAERLALVASRRASEVLAIAVMVEISRGFEAGGGGVGRDALRRGLQAGSEMINRAVDELVGCGLVQEGARDGQLLPARPPGSMAVSEVLATLRRQGAPSVLAVTSATLREIEELWDRGEEAGRAASGGSSISTLAHSTDGN